MGKPVNSTVPIGAGAICTKYMPKALRKALSLPGMLP